MLAVIEIGDRIADRMEKRRRAQQLRTHPARAAAEVG